ncbi:MAG TPA: hypothetical protein VGR26_18610, partial [Acidimicrobiales bacterium]|nr:hypothetical protein [Acidimicrobiales bacterium]
MNSPVLIAALVVPLVGAVAALLVPTGRARREKSPRRRRRKQEPTTEITSEGTDDDTVVGEPTRGRGVPAAAAPREEAQGLESPPDPAAVERAGLTSRTIVRVAALVAAALWVGVALLGPSSAGPARAIG